MTQPDNAYRFDEHERRLIALEQSNQRTEVTLADIQTRMAEMHMENRSRSDERERRAREDASANLKAIEGVSRRLDAIVSWRSIIGWAVVTASSAGVVTLLGHLTVGHS